MTEEQRKQRGLDAQRKPPLMQAFRCTECAKPYSDESEARECCACHGCGMKFTHKSADRDYWCGHCQRPITVKYLRESIERDEVSLGMKQRELEGNKARLARILATPRPAKGSPPEKL